MTQLRFLCFAIVVGELGSVAEGGDEGDVFCSCAQAAFLSTAVDGWFACETLPAVEGADSSRLEGQASALTSPLQQIPAQGVGLTVRGRVGQSPVEE